MTTRVDGKRREKARNETRTCEVREHIEAKELRHVFDAGSSSFTKIEFGVWKSQEDLSTMLDCLLETNQASELTVTGRFYCSWLEVRLFMTPLCTPQYFTLSMLQLSSRDTSTHLGLP